MLDAAYFFSRRSTDHKQRVNKKLNVEIDSRASSGGQGKYKKHVSFPWSPLESELSVLKVNLFLLKTIFEM
jgi:hypothetical protein